KYFAPNRTRRVFNERKSMLLSDSHQAREIARHTHLVHTKDGSRGRCNRRFYLRYIQVERIGTDIDKHWNRATVPDAVCGGDKRMADGDHFVSGADTGGK